jgi:hypothetical protein
VSSTQTGAPAFQRARQYGDLTDVARLEERVSQTLRRIPQQRFVVLSVPATIAAGDALVYSVVDGTGEVVISAKRPGQTVSVKSRGGALTVRDAGGAVIDGAATAALMAYEARTLLWTGSDWSIV